MDCISSFRFWMGCHGAPTPKLSRCWSSELKVVYGLIKKMSPELRKRLARAPKTATAWYDPRTGKIRVNGNPEALKRSQEYPSGYSRTILHAYIKWLKKHSALMNLEDCESSESDSSDDESEDRWDDCKLHEVLTFLSSTCDLEFRSFFG